MSKKETEFDRLDRMRKMEREAEAEKRKDVEISEEKKKKKVLKGKPNQYDLLMEDEYDYV